MPSVQLNYIAQVLSSRVNSHPGLWRHKGGIEDCLPCRGGQVRILKAESTTSKTQNPGERQVEVSGIQHHDCGKSCVHNPSSRRGSKHREEAGPGMAPAPSPPSCLAVAFLHDDHGPRRWPHTSHCVLSAAKARSSDQSESPGWHRGGRARPGDQRGLLRASALRPCLTGWFLP